MILTRLNSLKTNLAGDITGGLTAGIVALPLALAFGIASGLGASAGLYGAIILSFFASLLGGTKAQISGPTGPMTVIIATVVAVLEHNMALIVAVFVLAGIFQVLFGFLRFGKFVRFIPYPVISGFMSGVGVIIIILQIAPIFGSSSEANVIGVFLNLSSIIQNVNYSSISIATITLLILYLTPKKISSKIPAPLLALILLSIVVFIFDIQIATIGDIPTGLPEFIMPDFLDFNKISVIVSYAAMLALLGSIDSLLTSLVADSMSKTKHNSNQELIAQGIGNVMAGLFGGLVGAGATMRTVVNIKTGGKTKLSGIVSSLFLLLVLLVLGFLVSNVPLAVLSGILIKVGLDILDYRLLKRLKNAPTQDLIVMILVFFLTVFVDLIFAVGIGVVASSILLLYRISKEANVDIFEEYVDELNRAKNKVRVISINGAFFFGSTSQIIDRATSLIETNTLVIDCSSVPFIDLSAIYALEEMIDTQLSRKIRVFLILNNKQISYKSIKDVIKLVQEENVYTDRRQAIHAAVNYSKELDKAKQ